MMVHATLGITPVSDQAGEDRNRTAEDRDERAEVHDQVSRAATGRREARDVRAEVRERDGEHYGARDDVRPRR